MQILKEKNVIFSQRNKTKEKTPKNKSERCWLSTEEVFVLSPFIILW